MNIIGGLDRHEMFPSRWVQPRCVDVWCPPGYAEDSAASFPVIYMHDGQNLFDSAVAYGGSGWEIHRAMAQLMDAGEIQGAIVVGVWNSEIRWREYMPQKPYASPALQRHHETFLLTAGGEPVSDGYLRFIVEELKPFVDRTYRTQSDRAHTFVMGSSMGGLVSLYAISEYPDVFGGAACLSTHWPAGGQELVREMAKGLPDPRTHRLYFDHGTEGLDALYEPLQQQMDEALRRAGYVENENFLSLKFPAADHSEAAWRQRVRIPLSFLLSPHEMK